MPRRRRIPEAVSVQLAADILDVHVNTVRRWIRRDIIRAYRVGPVLVRIPRSEIARMRRVRIACQIRSDESLRYPTLADHSFDR